MFSRHNGTPRNYADMFEDVLDGVANPHVDTYRRLAALFPGLGPRAGENNGYQSVGSPDPALFRAIKGGGGVESTRGTRSHPVWDGTSIWGAGGNWIADATVRFRGDGLPLPTAGEYIVPLVTTYANEVSLVRQPHPAERVVCSHPLLPITDSLGGGVCLDGSRALLWLDLPEGWSPDGEGVASAPAEAQENLPSIIFRITNATEFEEAKEVLNDALAGWARNTDDPPCGQFEEALQPLGLEGRAEGPEREFDVRVTGTMTTVVYGYVTVTAHNPTEAEEIAGDYDTSSIEWNDENGNYVEPGQVDDWEVQEANAQDY